MKIIVADDEFFARKAIAQMISDWDDSIEIIEAEDGLSALEAVEKIHPALLLTDIRMPGMDGIRLAAEIHERGLNALVAIISGFDDFAYAQQAIEHKVENYLLKPVDRQELFPLLGKWKGRLIRSREAEREAALADVVCGEGEPGASAKIAAEPGLYFQVAAIRTASGRLDATARSVREWIAKRCADGLAVPDKHQEGLLVVWACYRNEAMDESDGLRFMLETYVRPAERESGGAVAAIGISGLFAEPGRLEEAYKQAKEAALQSALTESGRTVSGAEMAARFPYDAKLLREWTEAFRRKADNLQTREATEMIRQWLADAKSRSYSVYLLQDWFATTVNILNALVGRVPQVPEPGFIEWRGLFEYDSIEALGEDLIVRLAEIAARLKESESKGDIIDNLKDYVDENYKSRILLEDLAANKYFVDPSYLSRLFKRKSGMGFAQYLLVVRMEKAKRMLENDAELSVADVASEVGFNDYSYFIQTYKKVYGETPGKFRSGHNAGGQS